MKEPKVSRPPQSSIDFSESKITIGLIGMLRLGVGEHRAILALIGRVRRYPFDGGSRASGPRD
jgi:hypothetical protein